MADDVGTVINAEIQGVQIALKCTAETAKAILKLLSVIFGKDAAERKAAKEKLKQLLEEKDKLATRDERENFLRAHPLATENKDIIELSDGDPMTSKVPECFMKEGTGLYQQLDAHKITLPEDIQKTIANEPIISKQQEILKDYLENTVDLNAKVRPDGTVAHLIDRYTPDEQMLSAFQASIIKANIPVAMLPDDDPTDRYQNVSCMRQDAGMLAGITNSLNDAYRKNCDARVDDYHAKYNEAKRKAANATTKDDKDKFEGEAVKYQQAAADAIRDRDGVIDNVKLQQTFAKWAENPALKHSEALKDPKGARMKDDLSHDVDKTKAFAVVTNPDDIPKEGKRFYAGKEEGTYAEREYAVDKETGLAYSDYTVFKDGKVDTMLSDAQYPGEKWETEGQPKLEENLGISGQETVTEGATYESIIPAKPDRGEHVLSDDAKTLQKAEEKERTIEQNFNIAAEVKAAKPIAEKDGQVYFAVEVDGEKAVVSARNDGRYVRANGDTYDVSLPKDAEFTLYKADKDGKFVSTGEKAKTSRISAFGGASVPTYGREVKVSKKAESKTRK